MIFDGHSDTWADVTIRRLNGEKDVFRRIQKLNAEMFLSKFNAIFFILYSPNFLLVSLFLI
ncbi:hypothetical protein ACTPD5_21140 [Clostridioides difficile]|uniref:hypothetical protein n=1 Tax=Clostridioides difficile TaxID=1496 RepID=UPI003F8D6676